MSTSRSCVVLLLGWLLSGIVAGGAPAGAAEFFVNTNEDDFEIAQGDGRCSTGQLIGTFPFQFAECTLRAAIQEANALSGRDTIRFSASLATPDGFAVINPASALPFISSPMTIDGYSAPGYDSSDPYATPVIDLRGDGLAAGTNGLFVGPGASDTVIRGLAITRFPGNGIYVGGLLFAPPPSGVVVEGNHIGVAQGSFYLGNGGSGVYVAGAGSTTVGKSCHSTGCDGKGNVIVGHSGSGVYVDANDAQVTGNRIGTDVSGSTASVFESTGNRNWGVLVVGGSSTSIGLATPGAGNLISLNAPGGIQIESEWNTARGNYVGTDHSGSLDLGNAGRGIDLGGKFNVIGGTTPGAGNVVSGNGADGISSNGENTIDGNTISLTADRANALGNDGNGVQLFGLGALVRGNVIAANELPGIRSDGTDVTIVENRIGVNEDGVGPASLEPGIQVYGAATQVGAVGQGNVIGFQSDGIRLEETSSNIRIQGNFIGTGESGTDLGNAFDGIKIRGSKTLIGGPDGLGSGLGNVIVHNGDDGIDFQSSSRDGWVAGNFIGTNETLEPLPNHGEGLTSTGVNVWVGAGPGDPPSELEAYANVIAFNDRAGVEVRRPASQIAIRGNEIFENAELPIDLAADGPTENDFGDTDTEANRRQNFPEFDAGITRFNESTGLLELRYRVDSNPSDASYPLDIDFYLATSAPGEAEIYLGSDTYPASSASIFRSVAIQPRSANDPAGLLIATATDAVGNTSELSRQWVPVPEPDACGLLIAGIGWLGAIVRARSMQGSG